MVLHTPKGQFLINIDQVKNRLYLKIHDTNTEAAITNLPGIKKRLAAIGAELDIQPVNPGVAIVIVMPVK
jgi:signal transduction histidine kinase